MAAHEFAEDQLRANLGDMEWVERVARRHEASLEEVRSRATVVPMRMCTVYRTQDGVREMLRREASNLDEALSHLDGKTEWGLKGFVDPRRFAEHHSPQTDAEEEGAGEGASYMQRRRQERDADERMKELIEQTAAEIHERLVVVADDALVLPPQRPELSGHDGEMALNAAYLVDDGAEGGFREAVDELQEEFAAHGIRARDHWPLAGLQLRSGGRWSSLVTGATTLYASPGLDVPRARQVTLLDLLDRLLAGGVVIHGEITLAAADIDLVQLNLALMVASVDKAAGR